MSQPCEQEERIRKIENGNAVLVERVTNLTDKLSKFTNVVLGLIVTVIGGVTVTVIGGVILALLVYALQLGGV